MDIFHNCKRSETVAFEFVKINGSFCKNNRRRRRHTMLPMRWARRRPVRRLRRHQHRRPRRALPYPRLRALPTSRSAPAGAFTASDADPLCCSFLCDCFSSPTIAGTAGAPCATFSCSADLSSIRCVSNVSNTSGLFDKKSNYIICQIIY